ncbi:MAG: UbiA family prenyltransferase [Cyanophyceae cyanobacterium]
MTSNQLGQTYIPQWLYSRLLELLIYPSIWVAAGIASLGMFAQEVMDLAPDWQPIALLFVMALIPYNLDRVFDSYVQKIPEEQIQSYFRQPGIIILLLAAGGATAALLYFAPARVRLVSCAGIVPLLYGIPLFPWHRQGLRWYRLKDIPGSKAWIVGSVITYAVVALPLAYAGAEFDRVAALTTLFLFVFIVTNSHTFDIRDVESDRHKGVTTLPLLVGVRGTRVVLTAMNGLMLLVMTWGWTTGQIVYYPEMVLATGITLSYIWAVTTETPRRIYSIWIDGCLFVPLLLHWSLAAIARLS